MEHFNKETQNKLNDLLEKSYDAEKGFKNEAENTKSMKLKAFFIKMADKRLRYRMELKNALLSKGMEVKEDDGSIAGSLHRAWMDTKAFLSIDNDESILEEVRNGEKAALNDYDDILDNCLLDASTRNILLKHRAAIKESYDTADYLENIN